VSRIPHTRSVAPAVCPLDVIVEYPGFDFVAGMCFLGLSAVHFSVTVLLVPRFPLLCVRVSSGIPEFPLLDAKATPN